MFHHTAANYDNRGIREVKSEREVNQGVGQTRVGSNSSETSPGLNLC